MGIYRRPDSLFWWMALEGTMVRESTRVPLDGGTPNQTMTNRRQAQAVYAARMGDLARRRHHLPDDLEPRTFLEQRTWYAEHISPQKRSPKTEHSMLRQLGRFFDEHDLRAIDTALAREWRTWRLKDVSPATVDREEEILKHLLTTAVPKYLEKSPLAGFTSLRVAIPDTHILTPAEERRLLAAARTREDRALLVLALDTLLRLTDARSLTRRQDHRAYLFSDTKTTAIKIPVSTRLRQALDALPMRGRYYFPTYALVSNFPAIDMFRDTCARAKVIYGRKAGGVTFHCLRHTGASRMLANGADIKTVMTIGGWKNLAVLNRYLHPTDAASRAAVNSIGPHVPFTSRASRGKKARKVGR